MAVSILAVAALLASCVPPDDGTSSIQYNLRPLLEDGAIRLTWNVSVGGVENGYEAQVIDDSRQHLGWHDVPVTGIEETLFTNVANRTRYNFRIRELSPDGPKP